jgi:predicted MFS family arabinose efflux permease
MLAIGVIGWFSIAASSFGLAPLYPDISRDLGVGPDALGFILGLSSIASAIGQIPAGVLADKVGLRLPLLGGLAATAVAASLRGLSDGPLLFAIAQLAIGLAIPTFQAGSITGVAHAFEGRGRATAIALLFSAFNLGMVSSVVLLGALGSQVGWRFASLALAGLPVAVMPLTRLASKTSIASRGRSVAELTSDSLRFLRRRIAVTLAGVTILASTASVSNLFLMPFVLRSQGIDAAQTGLVLSSGVVGSIIGAPLVANVSDRVGLRRTLSAVFAISGAAVIAMTIFSTHLAAVAGGLLLIGTCLGGVMALTQSHVAEEANRIGVAPASALSGMRLAQAVGPGLAPTFAGFLFLHGGLASAEAFVVAALCGGLLVTRTISFRSAPLLGAGAEAVAD